MTLNPEQGSAAVNYLHNSSYIILKSDFLNLASDFLLLNSEFLVLPSEINSTFASYGK